ncbi:hypothetical protein PAAG_00212 [Paracoccidioides lutzii Pb01]|uniref:Uncharacterized protein n=1 Tax=Paracoccidioides lutzii (strain ATCC MYA-826 / Pb01) TaxID=502779 RepID=C1GNW7_PARBA|nr:hypothetical protein PAAG_00212 [Paracoccidioides lutzii Pb01]EEH35889.1 hypothetical protein PAAG_00212 [Paracoccidioides lutzii Pb01]
MPTNEVAPGPVNGNNHGPQPDLKEMLEYEKIVNLHDQIFSGNHPRLKVPQHVIRKVIHRPVQTPPLSAVPPIPAPAGTPAGVQAKQHPAPLSTHSNPLVNGSASATVSGVAASSSSSGPSGRVTAPKPVSEIDPIFLTKSDDLIRAEIQLQRQRIERVLREQLEQKKIDHRLQTCLQEAKPDFDVSEVLTKALQLVEPIATSDIQGANANTTASDSFDDNSFYSSRAPDSPQVARNEQPSPIREDHTHPVDADETEYEGSVGRRHAEGRRIDAGDPNVLDVDTQESPYNASDKRGPLLRSPVNRTPRRDSISQYPVREHPDVYDEPEYSPPGPDITSTVPREEEGEYIPKLDMSSRRRSNGRPVERGPDTRRNASPGHDIRVVRNHITSPAAPQPSKVSPLAVSRVPSLPQSRQRHTRPVDRLTSGHGSARTSPESAPQPLTSRKRRRLQENRDRNRVANERREADSPDHPYIKPEPISPPPFSDLPLAGESKPRLHHERPAFVDISSPQYSPVGHRRDSGQRRVFDEHPNRGYDIGNPIDLGVPRSTSRVTYRKPPRDDLDLRRVASLHNARQPEYIQDYPEPPPIDYQPRYVRGTSYAVTDRPVHTERARYYEEPAQPYSRHYVSGGMSPPSPRFRNPYPELEPEPRIMAPLPQQRRVVVDADGNRYVEQIATQTPRLQPLQPLPPPSARLSRMDPYPEGPPRLANGSVRAASIIEDPYHDRRYAQEMPPPPPLTYRRAPEEFRREFLHERTVYGYDGDERGVVDYVNQPPPARHATYVEEPLVPRDEVVRMASVRPPPSRYEERHPAVRQPMSRMQSVRPGGREISVYVDDEQPRGRRDYAPVERGGYGPAGAPAGAPAGVARSVREERYYDDEEVGKMDVEGMHDVVQRVQRRY